MGIIVGTMALFVVLSVFSGLKVFSLSFTNEIDPDLKITSTLWKIIFDYHQIRKIKLKKLKVLFRIPKLSKNVFCFCLKTNNRLPI